MDTNRAPHQHVLGTFSDLSIDSQEICLLQRFKAEEVVFEIAGIINLGINSLIVLDHDLVDFLGEERGISAHLVLKVVQFLSYGLDAAVSALVKGLYSHTIS